MDPARNHPAQLIELKCRNCGSPLSPEDISPQLSAARCRHCHSLFALPSAAGGRPIPRPQVPLPPNFRIYDDGYTLEITRRWRGPVAFFLLFFSLFWNGFMVVWHAISLSTGAWMMSAFGLLHTGVGIFIAYYTLALFINTTAIRADGRSLDVKIRPLPWKGNKSIAAVEISQLYCMEKISHGKNGSSASYRIEAVLGDNRRETLVSGLPEADHALFIEQQLERHLKIADVPVAGEHGR